jgi:K+-sensing histidine kinase KdpD
VATDGDPDELPGSCAVRRAAEALAAAEERAATAVVLFTAVARLHDARGRADVLAAIGEIAAGCLGSPDVAIHLHDPASDRLRRVHRTRPRAPTPAEAAARDEALVDRAAAERRIVVGPEVLPGLRDVAVPLGAAWTAGVMVLFSVPLEGAELAPDHRQRLEIVGRHLGIALASPRP